MFYNQLIQDFNSCQDVIWEANHRIYYWDDVCPNSIIHINSICVLCCTYRGHCELICTNRNWMNVPVTLPLSIKLHKGKNKDLIIFVFSFFAAADVFNRLYLWSICSKPASSLYIIWNWDVVCTLWNHNLNIFWHQLKTVQNCFNLTCTVP